MTVLAPDSLLESAYNQLDYANGELYDATASPNPTNENIWLDKGDWLVLAKYINAEKVFFVENNPVIIFAKQKDVNEDQWIEFFKDAWCMSRPQLLFLAKPGELAVYNLSKSPPHQSDDNPCKDRLIETIASLTQVQELTQQFHREQIESGKLFEEERFGFEHRADRTLINLKTVISDG